MTIDEVRQDIAAMYQAQRRALDEADGSRSNFAIILIRMDTLKAVLDLFEKVDPVYWSDPFSDGFINAWNGFYTNVEDAFRASVDGLADERPRVLNAGDGLISDELETR